MSEARVEWLTISGEPDAWRAIGLAVDDEGFVPLFGTGLRIERDAGDARITGWALSGIADTNEIAGLRTQVVAPSEPSYAEHRLGAVELDHVVVLTDALDDTAEAVTAATGCELKRVRDTGTFRQGFHRIGRGGLIVELVERIGGRNDAGGSDSDDPDNDEDPDDNERGGDAPARRAPANRFWGVVITVEDIDAVYHLLGDELLSAPKEAVQPGRRIATVRGEAGLGMPVALMTRDVR